MNAEYLDWYKKGFWFKKGGYYYRHVSPEKGQYMACGFYPGNTRGCGSMLLTELVNQGYEMITEKELILHFGFRPNSWNVPIHDGSVAWHSLWEHLMNNCDKPNVWLDNIKCVRKYYESE